MFYVTEVGYEFDGHSSGNYDEETFTPDMKEELINAYVLDMIDDSKYAMKKILAKLIKTKCIDYENYDPENNRMIIPKSIMCALLETELKQYRAKGTCYEKEVKNNTKFFRSNM